jgi:uncharacterized membrane protein
MHPSQEPDHAKPTVTPRRTAAWHPRSASGRLLAAVAAGFIALAVVPAGTHWQLRGAIAWDIGAMTLVALAWSMILHANAETTRLRAANDDPGRNAVVVIAICSSVFSLFAALFVIRHAKADGVNTALWVAVGTVAVILSWVVTHTTFALRYARLHYRPHCEGGGIDFPGGRPPCDMDFVYFSFVIGMCFQVSDVTISRAHIRRTVLVHSMLSFVYNTVVVATVLNLVFAFLN